MNGALLKLRVHSWKAIFRTVRAGQIQNNDGDKTGAILLGIAIDFHAESRRTHRFTHARNMMELSKASSPPTPEGKDASFVKFAPRTVVDRPTEGKRRVGWAFKVKCPVWDVASASISSHNEWANTEAMVIQGTGRGNPTTRIVWTLDENNRGGQGQVGLPYFF